MRITAFQFRTNVDAVRACFGVFKWLSLFNSQAILI